MSTDLLERVTRGVRALADAVPVTPPDPDELIRRAEAHAGPRPALTGWRARAGARGAGICGAGPARW